MEVVETRVPVVPDVKADVVVHSGTNVIVVTVVQVIVMVHVKDIV